jgi:hypothetical protein|tara:strand:- start:180 stop:335 length:156 start_codon:yes stop_codon:yes gene_type:complete
MNINIYLEAWSDLSKIWEYNNPYCEKLNTEKHNLYKKAALKIIDGLTRGDT